MGSGEILEAQISASSSKEFALPDSARINNAQPPPINGGIGWWSPQDDDLSPYIQIDFIEPTEISGIATQGRVYSYYVDYYVSNEWKTISIERMDYFAGKASSENVVFGGKYECVDHLEINNKLKN